MVVGVGAAEVLDLRRQELGRLERRHPVEGEQLVEGAVELPLGRGAVVADDVVDEGVVEQAEVFDRLDDPTHVVVGMLQEAGVDLHLAGQDRLQRLGHVVPGRDLRRPRGELGLGRDHAQVLLQLEGLAAQMVPAQVEAAPVALRPFGPDVMRGVGGPRREIGEERLVGHERLLLADPVDAALGQVLGQVVGGVVRRFDGHRVLVERRRVLVGLSRHEAVEVLEARPRRPPVERAEGAGLPRRDLVALAELPRGVPVQPEDLGQGRARVGPHGGVTRRGGGEVGHRTHADGVVVAPREQRGAAGRAQRGGVEAPVAQPARGQAVGRRRGHRTAEGAGGTEADVVEQDDQHVGRAGRRAQRHDRRERRVGVLGVVGDEPAVGPVGDGQHGAQHPVAGVGGAVVGHAVTSWSDGAWHGTSGRGSRSSRGAAAGQRQARTPQRAGPDGAGADVLGALGVQAGGHRAVAGGER